MNKVGSVHSKLCAGARTCLGWAAPGVWRLAAPRSPASTSRARPPAAQSTAVRTSCTAWWTWRNPHCAHGACTLLDLCPGAWHACLNVHVLLATSDWRLAGRDGGTLALSAQDVLAEGFCCTLAQMGAPNMSPSASWAGSATHCGPHKLYGMVDVNNKHCAHGACTLLDLCPGAWHACSNVHVLLATSDWRLAGRDGGTLALSAQDVLAEGFCCALA